jgi:FAD/FMN-containing dehydrogenase/SAM-dependent methyltransferase
MITVNDVTQLNRIEVAGVAAPTNTLELENIIRNTSLPLSIGGGHFSMGGQTASNGTLHIDMRAMNHVLSYDKIEKRIHVEAGIRWCDIQALIDEDSLSVKTMQTYANFTVGGSLSVNAHGRYMGLGPVVLSVRSVKVIFPSGASAVLSPTQDRELFYAVIGGYGAVAVIAEVELDLAINTRVARIDKKMRLSQYGEWFKRKVRDDEKVVFHNADIYPPHYNKVRAVSWLETDRDVTTKTRLQPIRKMHLLEKYFMWTFTETPFGKNRREYLIDPLLYLAKPVHWRNYEAGYDVRELEPVDRRDRTYVLQEYFVPVESLEAFTARLASILANHNVNAVNVSIRHAKADPGTLMSWARGETFAFVLYYKQRTHSKAKDRVGVWTRELIDAAVACAGTYYLPYQLHATAAQFHSAYPNAKKLFKLKRKYDPNYRLRNALWNKYYAPEFNGDAPQVGKSVPTSKKKEPHVMTSHFKDVYNNPDARGRFYMFLKNIFNIVPADKLHALITEAAASNSTDKDIYCAVQKGLPAITPALSLFRYALPALADQKSEMGNQSEELARYRARPFVDYVEIGTTGRYVKALQRRLDLEGSVTLVNDKAPTMSPTDIVERGQLRKLGSFKSLDNYQPLSLPSNSADLVSCFVGLHHMSPEKLEPFVASVARVLRTGGMFILREHDVTTPEVDTFVSLAHAVFNAGLGEAWETNIAEERHFASVATWIERMAVHGLRATGLELTQAGDPSDNILLAFVKG